MDRDTRNVAARSGRKTATARKTSSTSAASQLRAARAQQAAVNEILRVMADAPADVTVVLDTIAKEAAQLCHAPFARMTVLKDGVLYPLAGYAVDGKQAPSMPVPLRRTSILGRSLLERRTLNFADVTPLLETEYPDALENARLMGFRAVMAVPLLRGEEGLGAMFLYRREPGLFTDDQVTLVETFARQAAIALHSVAQFRATQEALEQQTATSEILRVINRAHDDVQPVFDTIAQSSLTLCAAASSVVVILDEGTLKIGALASTTQAGADFLRAIFPRPPSRANGATRAVLTQQVIVIPDILDDTEYATTDAALASGFRSVLAVPLMRDGVPIGAISLGRDVPGPFPPSHVDLLQTFAAQAVIALENVRLFTELGRRNAALTESLEQRTATSDILAVISRSPTDAQPVFDTIAENALRLCEGVFSAVYRFDGEMIHIGALRNISPEGDVAFQRTYPCKPHARGTTQRAVLTGEMVHMPDVRLEPDYGYLDVADAARFRSVLAVPMLRDGATIGAIAVYREVAGAFPDAKIALLKTFADQAVIAVQNVRLFNELEARNRDLSEALEQQTATADILRVISRSQTNVQPVFDTIAAAALKLCRAASALVTRVDGDLVNIVASANLTADGAEAMRQAFPMPITRGATSVRAILERRMIAIPDVLEDKDYRVQEHALRAAFRSTLAIPLLRDGLPIGTITVGKPERGPFSDSQVALLQTFAEQAVIAVENVRLFNELGARNRDLTESLEQQTATSDILRVISKTPTSVQPVFDTIAESALRLCGADSAIVTTLNGEMLELATSANASEDTARRMHRRYPRPLGRGTATGRAILTRRVVMIPDALADPEYDADNATAQFRSAVAVPLLRDGEPIGAIGVGRTRTGAFSSRHVALLETFADQAVIAIENVRLFNEREARNRDLTESLEQQTATSDILRVISQSQTDVQPVFQTIADAISNLCRTPFGAVYIYDGKLVHLTAHARVGEAYAEFYRRLFPRPLSRGTGVLRAISDGRTCTIPDVQADPEYDIAAQASQGGFRSVLAVPLLREGVAIGGIAVGRLEPGAFPPSQAALLQTFADQAVIAIENVRLFTELGARNRDLTESLEQQTATSDILRVISRSQTDVQPVFDTIAASVLSLCRARFANVFTYDGELIHIAAIVNEHPEYIETVRSYYPQPPSRNTAVTRAIATGEMSVIPDVLADADYQFPAASAGGGFRSILAVPLMREGRPVGGIAVGRPEPGLFPESQVALLKTFADQAVIAIENVRLFNELGTRNRALTEALEQQTATSDILRVISQSQTDVQPVFDTIVRSVLALCDATFSGVYLFDGETLSLAATAGLLPADLAVFSKGYPRKIGRDTVSGLAALECRVVHTDDIMAEPAYAGAPGTFINARTVLAVPLVRDGRAIGSIGVWRAEVKPFGETQVALLQTFADQAVIAIENVRLFNELQARTAQLTRSVGELRALGEVGQAVSSTLDLGTVLSTIVARATHLSGVAGGSIYEYDEEKQTFLLHSSHGLPEDILEALRALPMRRGSEGALGRMAITGQPVEIRDVANEREYRSHVRDRLIKYGLRSMLAVPLLRENHLLGGLVINRKAPGAFDPQVVELLKTFATQSAMAIQNARLYREIEIKSRELETASRHKSEFLANMSHELRTPLNAIIGFSEVLGERLFGELNDKQSEYVVDIADSGRHLLELINDILDLSKIEAGRMELDADEVELPRTIAQTLVLVRERAERRGIALSSAIDPAVGTIVADARKVKQVLLNLLSNALKFTPHGGRIDVRAAAFDDRFEVSVTDTGVGIAPEDQEAVFEEFRQVGASAARVEGTGLGLAISRKFIELHGGRLWLESTPGVGSTFTFSLPLRR